MVYDPINGCVRGRERRWMPYCDEPGCTQTELGAYRMLDGRVVNLCSQHADQWQKRWGHNLQPITPVKIQAERREGR